MQISIIIPTLDEAGCIIGTLQPLQALRDQGIEVILVDGGSRDNTVELARPFVDRLLGSSPGRARQMNCGARQACGQILWFLHADTLVPGNSDQLIVGALEGKQGWGRFDVRLSGNQRLLRLVEGLMNLRSRMTGISTGDQGLFVTRHLFEEVGGYADIPLMEDIDLSKRLKRKTAPACIRKRLVTSSRRWEQRGILKTILLMWYLRLAYFVGVPAERLAMRYE